MTPPATPPARFLIPTMIGLIVVPAALILLTIGARSPYTQANLNPHYDASYTRTDQTFVGPAVPLVGPGVSVPASADPVAHGQQLFTANYCSGCHGLDGRGSIIGPSIVGATAAKLGSKTHSGPGAMPAFEASSFSSDEFAAMAAYLASMNK